ncbi:tyrosine-type recombinase/integrase [Citrobacter freundii]|uniref:Tyrosine-type recombinase/integrase n=1 Tax=Citrobacter freundii TaxID=546 RepID=A0AAN4A6M9_CITFR|nr:MULTISPECIES: integrase arm-type DNA-binding domain-containing protein [Citrobacter]EKV4647110.1 tyrosine-type recombinase/integrase [Citrobacter freundii]EKW7208886.1 tyrosine-type recombinase/integrase [Citrobacter freundii]ELO0986040.1 tyrosine-type recombinase/integrase [Citrobacter freundii]ELV3679416.1 tyrosine-type recombinase/integrase [Citrobacter freundii]MBJ9641974.1 tyrosine-type recombinase/integrase [Citrobacter sp. FDAARGOS_156]
MKLTARQVSTAKPTDKPYKLSDGGGLYLLVNPNGSRYWRMKYRYAGKEKLLSIGVYPDVTLAEARDKRTEAKRVLAAGDDPSEVKQAAREAKNLAINNSFELLALEWHEHKKPNWSSGYAEDILEYLRKDIFPYVGKKAITEIKPMDMLSVLRKMEERGVLDKLKKTRQACRQIFTYAIITGRAEVNPVTDLAGALKSPKQNHFPHLLPAELGPFIHAVNAYSGSKVTRIATLLLMYTSVRTIELRASEWAEFDLDNDLWQIPKERMKMRRPHLVPLSRQVKSHLLELKEITGWGKYVFPGRNDAHKPMSEASINQVIKRIGYGGKATGHGFRHTMSTVLHEKGFDSAWIETQLAHADRNTIRGTYNHAQYLDGRREMLQWYADYLDELAGKVVE